MLRKQGYDVRYAGLDANTGMFDFLRSQVQQTNAQQLLTFAITDYSLRRRIQAFARTDTGLIGVNRRSGVHHRKDRLRGVRSG